jgi:DNA-binding Lrp family transcriptional regulator
MQQTTTILQVYILKFVIITIMKFKLDDKDLAILNLVQKNCKMTAREIAKTIDSPVTTVFAKIKRMEKLGVIKGYRAVLDSKKLNKGTTAFILASVSYGVKKGGQQSQRKIAKEIAIFPEVQEVASIGKFVIDKLRLVDGIEKTLTCMVFETEKETTNISLER